jgi:histidine kinase 2/3/4 (cytokinin receptor)
MDGFEATRRIRAVEARVNKQADAGDDSEADGATGAGKWHLPVLAMTADVIQATHEECTKCGMDGYVTKPFEEKQLFQAVQKFLDPGMSS